MKYVVLAFFLVFASYRLQAQHLNGKSISLRTSIPMNGKQFFIETICYKKDIKIKVKVRDSVSHQNLKKDTLFKTLTMTLMARKPDIKNDTVQVLFARLDSAIKVNTFYTTDSVKIKYKDFPNYERLISDLFISSQRELEKKASNRFVLHGIRMKFEFFQNGSLQFFADAHSPSRESNPLLYDYLTTTKEILQKSGKKMF